MKRHALEPVQLELAGSDVQRRPRMPARGAAVVTEMPDVGRGIHIGRPAANAPLGVGGVLELSRGVSRVVEPKRDRICMTRGEVRSEEHTAELQSAYGN